jgi:hypothetical protein
VVRRRDDVGQLAVDGGRVGGPQHDRVRDERDKAVNVHAQVNLDRVAHLEHARLALLR